MAIILAAIGELLRIGVVGLRPEHPGVFAVAGDALSAQIPEVPAERAALAPVAHHARLDGAEAGPAGDDAVGAQARHAAAGEGGSPAMPRRDLAG